MLAVFVYSVEAFAGGPVVGFTIDGVDLRDHIYPIELPFAQNEGHSEFAGSYEGLPASQILPPSRHLLGEPRPPGAIATALLGCECGEWGCWPLLADVHAGPDEVVWSDFRQPHREAPDRQWTYDGLGPFRFGRPGYEAALNQPWMGPTRARPIRVLRRHVR